MHGLRNVNLDLFVRSEPRGREQMAKWIAVDTGGIFTDLVGSKVANVL